MNTRITTIHIGRRFRRSGGLAGALAAGVALGSWAGCSSGSVANPDHCFNAEGDRSCQEWFGDERRYCASPEPSCGEQADRGCVADQPPSECHSPCGAGLVASEDPDCSGVADDESSGSEAEGNGDGDGDGEGDDGEPAAVCGDGVTADSEECDDGNAIDDDGCSNACVAARCGDGVVQLEVGELCDDGNESWGDTCTAECRPPGEVVWSRLYAELGDCSGADVVINTTGELRVSADCEDWRLLGFDSAGELQWNRNGVESGRSMARRDDDFLVLGGSINLQGGHLRYFNPAGSYQWHYYLYDLVDLVHAVAIAPTGELIAAGDLDNDLQVQRVTTDKELVWTYQGIGGWQALGLAVNDQDHTRVLQSSPLQVLQIGPTGDLVWSSAMFSQLGGFLGGLAIGSGDETYAAWQTSLAGFSLTKLDALGEALWTYEHNDLGVDEAALAIEALPGGMALVSGFTNYVDPEADGLLSWFSPEGELVHEVVLDNPEANDGDALAGVAVSPEGYGVAVGVSETESGSALWLVRFTL